VTNAWISYAGSAARPADSTQPGGYVIKAYGTDGTTSTAVYTNTYFVIPELCDYGVTVMSISLPADVIMALGICLYMMYLFSICVAHKGRMLLVEVFSTFTTVIYILVGFSALSIIRYLPFGEYEFLLAFFTAWGCDMFAYFVGTFIGKHKLIVEVSPKKTVEGAIGGVVCTFAIIMLYGFLIERFVPGVEANYIALAILGLVLPVVSQIGDLFASLIKREAGIKDYSKIFPGHGGVIDRFDSMIAVAIVTLMITMIMPPFH
jgi:phosphatidate cytidylyltransferase